MRIMFVCTGNICRSPMGELLLKRYLVDTSVQISSAGTRGLPAHPIDSSSAKLMTSVGIDSSEFRSRRLTRSMAKEADLILCFEEQQRKDIVVLEPTAIRYTVLLTEFADMCVYCGQHNLVKGTTIQERLTSVINSASTIRPLLPKEADIDDPHGQAFEKFRIAANQTNEALRRMLLAMRKHYYDEYSEGRK